MMAMLKALVGVGLVFVAACGGVAEEPASKADAEPAPAPVIDAAVDAPSVAPNPACIETDESIAACARAASPASWTAPGSCLKDFVPDLPQKRRADGSIVQRQNNDCCGFVVSEGVTALCCADYAICTGR